MGFGVIAVAAVLVGLTTAGANATQNSALALPRNATLYVSGSAWGPECACGTSACYTSAWDEGWGAGCASSWETEPEAAEAAA